MNKVFQAVRKGGKWLVVAAPAAALTTNAAAQAVDTTAAVAAITSQSGALTAIGTAVVAISVVYMIFKWIKSMIKG